MPNIHPTAIVHGDTRIADDAAIGPYCVIESDVEIGSQTVIREHAVIRRYTTLGKNNLVDAMGVIGGEPQDLKFDPEQVTYVRIGDNNVFREGVTISRATGEGNVTVVGNNTYWMAGAHAGHNTVIEDYVILTNGCAIGGHATIGRRAILSSYVGVHQFCWVGEMVMLQGHAGTSTHVPPYTMIAGINRVVGINSIGLRRAEEITDEDRRQIKEAFRITYRSGLTTPKALEKMDACNDWGEHADKFRQFVRRVLNAKPPHNRPLCPAGGSIRKRR